MLRRLNNELHKSDKITHTNFDENNKELTFVYTILNVYISDSRVQRIFARRGGGGSFVPPPPLGSIPSGKKYLVPNFCKMDPDHRRIESMIRPERFIGFTTIFFSRNIYRLNFVGKLYFFLKINLRNFAIGISDPNPAKLLESGSEHLLQLR